MADEKREEGQNYKGGNKPKKKKNKELEIKYNHSHKNNGLEQWSEQNRSTSMENCSRACRVSAQWKKRQVFFKFETQDNTEHFEKKRKEEDICFGSKHTHII